MIKNLQTYSAIVEDTIIPGAPPLSGRCHLDLVLNTKLFLIKSITWNLDIYNNDVPPRPLPLPLEQNFTQQYHLIVQPIPVAANISNVFYDFVAASGAILTSNGSNVLFKKPGQYKFDSWKVNNSVRFNWFYENYDALITYRYLFGILVDIEIIDTI